MDWTLKMEDFEEALIRSHKSLITFEQYDQQDDYGTERFKKLNIFDDEKIERVERYDAVDELKLFTTVNKCRIAKNKQRIGAQSCKIGDISVEEEITALLEESPFQIGKKDGNVKWSERKDVDKMPVVGKKNVYLTSDFFKFDNPRKSASESDTSRLLGVSLDSHKTL